MSENDKTKTTPKRFSPQPVTEEVQRGVWVDGIGLGLSSDYVIIEGIVGPPRAEKTYIAARLLLPPRLLEHLAKSLAEAVQKQKELKPPQVEQKTKIK